MGPFLRRWALLCLIAFFSLLTLYNIHRLSPLQLSLSSLFGGTSHLIAPTQTNWKEYSQYYPVQSIIPLPTGAPKPIPRIQHEFGPEFVSDRRERLKRRNAVRDAFRHSWRGYCRYAWMHDEVRPISGGYRDHFGGWGVTLVDALDSLQLMQLDKEFAVAVAALRKIDFTNAGTDILNIFETTIRFLGGLLSAYDMSDAKYPTLLEKAIQLGDMLYAAFDTPNRMPVTRWYWRQYVCSPW
jgi:mannosyl-oligosaccharide alpha-1,2-mannosidase